MRTSSILLVDAELMKLRLAFARTVPFTKNREAVFFLAQRIYWLHLHGQHLNQSGLAQEVGDVGLVSVSTAVRIVNAFVERGYLWVDKICLRPTDAFLRQFLGYIEGVDDMLIKSGLAAPRLPTDSPLLYDRDGDILLARADSWLSELANMPFIMDLIHPIDRARRFGWDHIQQEIQRTFDMPPPDPIKATVLFNNTHGNMRLALVEVTVDQGVKKTEIFPIDPLKLRD